MVLRNDSTSLMLIPQVTVVPEAAMVAADWCPSFACDLVGSVAQQVMGRSYRRHMAYPLIIYIALYSYVKCFFSVTVLMSVYQRVSMEHADGHILEHQLSVL